MSVSSPSIGLVTFDPQADESLVSLIKSAGFEVKRFPNLADWIQHHRSPTNGDAAALVSHGTLLIVAGAQEQISRSANLPEAHATFPGYPIVALVREPTLEGAVGIMRQGAADVVSFPCTADQLQTAIKRALDAAAPKRKQFAQQAELKSRLSSLTRAEKEVLEAMLAGMANKQIAQLLQIGLRTVELRRSKIMRKMQSRNLAELVKMVCEADPQLVERSTEMAAQHATE